MAELYLQLLESFSFTQMQVWIAAISAMLFSANLLGGILSALMFVNSRKIKQRPLKERISFRLFCFSELILLIFIFFYHVFMIESIQAEHVIYWVSAMIMMPLLAVTGSQSIFVTYSGKMAEKAKSVQREEARLRKAQREKRSQNMNGSPAGYVNPLRSQPRRPR